MHLHVHSEFSLLDGLSPVKHIVDTAKRGGHARGRADRPRQPVRRDRLLLATPRAPGIKPILGVETYVSPRGMADKVGSAGPQLLPPGAAGQEPRSATRTCSSWSRAPAWRATTTSRASTARCWPSTPEGLIALSACYSGEPSRAILEGDFATRAARPRAGTARSSARTTSSSSRTTATRTTSGSTRGCSSCTRRSASRSSATNDTHYAVAEQAAGPGHPAVRSDQQHRSRIPKRMRMQPGGAFYLKSPDEMWQLFGDVPDALRNTVAIAERCDLQLRVRSTELSGARPRHSARRSRHRSFWRARARRGCGGATARRSPRRTASACATSWTWSRRPGSRRTSCSSGTSSTGRANAGIPCGPRGSAAGSIILYCLGISDLDPVRYGLTFERFLNPERIQMPDIDMDFADDRRDEVIQYVIDRYGRDRVAQIITFGRLLARAAIRDVGRALDYPLNEVDRVAKLMPPIPIGLKIDRGARAEPRAEVAVRRPAAHQAAHRHARAASRAWRATRARTRRAWSSPTSR